MGIISNFFVVFRNCVRFHLSLESILRNFYYSKFSRIGSINFFLTLSLLSCRIQHELEVSTKQAIFVDSSISDTIRTCIVLGNHRAAMKVKTEFKVCSLRLLLTKYGRKRMRREIWVQLIRESHAHILNRTGNCHQVFYLCQLASISVIFFSLASQVSEKRWYWLKVFALATIRDWDALEKFSKEKRPPIGNLAVLV